MPAVGNVIDQPQVSRQTWSANRDSPVDPDNDSAVCTPNQPCVSGWKCDRSTTGEQTNMISQYIGTACAMCNVHALSVARKCDEPTTRENANWSANKNSLWITRVYLSAYIYFFFHTSIYFKPTNATIFYLLIVMNCSSRLLEFKSLGIFSISFSLLKYGIFSIFGFLTV